jgi:hypothetical protein
MNLRITKNGIGGSRNTWCQLLKLLAADNLNISFESSLKNRHGVVDRVIGSIFYFFIIFLSQLTSHPMAILTVYRK